MLTENLHRVALLAGDVRHVYQGHVHTDVAHVGSPLPIDKTVASSASQMAVESVGIADGYGGDDAVAMEHPLAAVAHGLFFGHMAHLQDGGLQRRYGVECLVVARVDTVQTQSQTAHIQLTFREMLYAG